LTANTAISESEKGRKKDVTAGKISVSKKKCLHTKTTKRRKSKKKMDGKTFRKSLRSQAPPECNSSGSDLATHFAPKAKKECTGKIPSEKSGSEVDESVNMSCTGYDHVS